MPQPFVGEIRLVGFSFAPVDWAFCDGSIIAITQNPTLFQLIGTTYGGDGQTTFALPDLRSRVPVHQGSTLGTNYTIGQSGGVEDITLTVDNMAQHTHAVFTAQLATSVAPAGNYPAASTNPVYASPGTTHFESGSIGSAGGGLPHENRQPFLALNYIISLYGIFPTQN